MRASCCTQSREKAISGPAASGSRRNGCSGGIATASTRPGRCGRSFVSINLGGSNLDEGASSGERRSPLSYSDRVTGYPEIFHMLGERAYRKLLLQMYGKRLRGSQRNLSGTSCRVPGVYCPHEEGICWN